MFSGFFYDAVFREKFVHLKGDFFFKISQKSLYNFHHERY